MKKLRISVKKMHIFSVCWWKCELNNCSVLFCSFVAFLSLLQHVLRTELPRCKTQLLARSNICFVWASFHVPRFVFVHIGPLLSNLQPSKYQAVAAKKFPVWCATPTYIYIYIYISVLTRIKLFRRTAFIYNIIQYYIIIYVCYIYIYTNTFTYLQQNPEWWSQCWNFRFSKKNLRSHCPILFA